MNNVAIRSNKAALIAGALIFSIIILLLAMRPGGIGGTGIGNGGVGGTGINTGFIGRIDQFGSIYVNDARIFYPDDIKVQLNQKTGSISDLRIGQIVEVLANADSNGVLIASTIKVRYAVIGSVQSIAENQAIVFGQKVLLSADIAKPRIGQNIAVSGFLRADGVIVASRIDAAQNMHSALPDPLQLPFLGQTEKVSLSGYVEQRGNGYFIYGYQLNDIETDISLNKVTTISAIVDAKTLRVKSLKRKITVLTSAPIETLPIPVNEITEPAIIPTNIIPDPVMKPKPTIREAINKPVIERAGNIPNRAKIDNPATEQSARTIAPSPVRQPTEQEIDNSSTDGDHDLETDVVRQEDRDSTDNQASQTAEQDTARETEPITTLPVEPVVTERPQSPQNETRPQTNDRPPTRVRPERVERPQRPERIERPERPQRPQRPNRGG